MDLSSNLCQPLRATSLQPFRDDPCEEWSSSSRAEDPFTLDWSVDGEVNLFYNVGTTYVMPALLLLQWVLEMQDESLEGEYSFGFPVAVLLFVCMASPYRETVKSVTSFLAPVTFLTIADMLVLFHRTHAAIGTMFVGLFGMVFVVLHGRWTKRCIAKRYPFNAVDISNEQGGLYADV